MNLSRSFLNFTVILSLFQSSLLATDQEVEWTSVAGDRSPNADHDALEKGRLTISQSSIGVDVQEKHAGSDLQHAQARLENTQAIEEEHSFNMMVEHGKVEPLARMYRRKDEKGDAFYDVKAQHYGITKVRRMMNILGATGFALGVGGWISSGVGGPVALNYALWSLGGVEFGAFTAYAMWRTVFVAYDDLVREDSSITQAIFDKMKCAIRVIAREKNLLKAQLEQESERVNNVMDDEESYIGFDVYGGSQVDLHAAAAAAAYQQQSGISPIAGRTPPMLGQQPSFVSRGGLGGRSRRGSIAQRKASKVKKVAGDS